MISNEINNHVCRNSAEFGESQTDDIISALGNNGIKLVASAKSKHEVGKKLKCA